MQRLIDANKLEYTCNSDECGMLTGCNHCQYNIITEDEIDNVPTVLEIPEHPTNGDMIKALFPNTRFSTSTEDTIAKAFIRPNGSVVINDYCDDWWNAPYKPQKSEDKDSKENKENDKDLWERMTDDYMK